MYKVLNAFILVKPDPDEWTHDNATVNKALKEEKLFLPENKENLFKKVARRGTVINWGPACKYSYRFGDRIIYGQFAGAPIDKEFRIINEIEALALEDPNA